MEHMKEVYFSWCQKCKHYHSDEIDGCCDDCISVPGRMDSHMPIHFEPEQTDNLSGNKKKSEDKNNG